MNSIACLTSLAACVVGAHAVKSNATDAYTALDAENFKVAAVRQPPVNFPLPVAHNKTWVDLDLNATVAQAIETIQEAAAEGVAFLAFPELYFPGYPVAINFDITTSQIAQYVSQSMSVDSNAFKSLAQAFGEAGIYGSFGFSELGDNVIYMSQTLIGPDGFVLFHRRKLRPSGAERDVFSDGGIDGLVVQSTPHGRIGMLECAEHFHPTMSFVMLAQAENIHVGAWPLGPDEGSDPLGWESTEVIRAAARSYAVNSGAPFIMPAVGASAIFEGGGLTLNSSDATGNPDMHYITATINTTSFSNATYNADGEQGWAALVQMLTEFPAYIPKTWGSFFDTRTNLIDVITAE